MSHVWCRLFISFLWPSEIGLFRMSTKSTLKCRCSSTKSLCSVSEELKHNAQQPESNFKVSQFMKKNRHISGGSASPAKGCLDSRVSVCYCTAFCLEYAPFSFIYKPFTPALLSVVFCNNLFHSSVSLSLPMHRFPPPPSFLLPVRSSSTETCSGTFSR